MDNTYLLIQILSLLIGAGALGRLKIGDRVKWVMQVYTCIYLLYGLNIFSDDKYYLHLIGGIIIGVVLSFVCSRLYPVLDTHEAKYLSNELSKMNTAYGMLMHKNQQLESILVNLDKKYVDTNSDFRFLLSELSMMYSEKNVEGNYNKLCLVVKKLIPMLNKPYMVYTDRNPEMFNQLVTKRDYRRAKKAIKEFKSEFYFGDGFDKELNYYIELLEKGEANAISRVQQKAK